MFQGQKPLHMGGPDVNLFSVHKGFQRVLDLIPLSAITVTFLPPSHQLNSIPEGLS